MKRLFLYILLCASPLFGMVCPANADDGTLKLVDGSTLNFQVSGLSYFESDTKVEPPSGYSYPIFKTAEYASHFLSSFMSGLQVKRFFYGTPIRGRANSTISVSATFRATKYEKDDYDYAGLAVMLTPIRMAFAKSKGEEWAHAIEKKIEYREAEGSSGETFSVNASIQFDNTMQGVIISLVTTNNNCTGAANIYVFDDYKETVTDSTTATFPPGEQPTEGGDIPWEWIVPGALITGGLVARRLLQNKNEEEEEREEEEEEREEEEEEREEEEEEEREEEEEEEREEEEEEEEREEEEEKEENEEEEEEQEEPSTFRMILWKDCSDTLELGDAPVQVGARIEEITPKGDHKDRPDLTAKIHISEKENVKVENQRQEGKYMKADVTAQTTLDGKCPEKATVSFIFENSVGRYVNNLIFKVEDAATILVGPALSFAASQGKTLFMEFQLCGILKEPESLNVKLDAKGAKYFDASLEQDEDVPSLFRIHLTECGVVAEEGKAKPVAGTIETCYCTIEATTPDGKKTVSETFDIYRIHLGMRVEMRALKAYLVELESTPNHDIMPPKESERRKKFADSYVEWQLVVVDEEDCGAIKSVKPETGPEFIFEDDFTDSKLFVSKDMGKYIPTMGEFREFGDKLFWDAEGAYVPSPCDTLKFKYEPVGKRSDDVYWGVVRATGGYLVSPNRSHAKVTVKMTWGGQEYKEELRVPINSQPFREVNVPEGGDVVRALHEWDKREQKWTENLEKIQQEILLDKRFAEIRPLFYKVTVMLNGYNSAFGFDKVDYETIMSIYERFRKGEIGSAFAVRHTVNRMTEDDDAMWETLCAMDKDVKVIALRIGLGIVTAGASELVLTPVSSLIELKEYVDKGGDSAMVGFLQVSAKLIAWELAFAAAGKVVSAGKKGFQKGWKTGWNQAKEGYGIWEGFKSGFKEAKKNIYREGKKSVVKGLNNIKRFVRNAKNVSKQFSQNAGKLSKLAAKSAENQRINKALSDYSKDYGTSKAGNNIKKAGEKGRQIIKSSQEHADDLVKKTLNSKSAPKEIPNATKAPKEIPGGQPNAKVGYQEAKQITENAGKTTNELANDAIKKVRSNGKLYNKTSILSEEADKRARQEAQKILDEFQRVMNNPTATKEQMLKATLNVQGNKTAQNLLRYHQSDLLRANFNAQMQQFYKELDPVVIKRLEAKLIAIDVKNPEVRVWSGATGNAGDDLRLGKKIGADRDVTYQIKDPYGNWVDLRESLMEEAYSEALSLKVHGSIPNDREILMEIYHRLDQAVMNGPNSKGSYGKGLKQVIDPLLQSAKFEDPNRISGTFVYKCNEWFEKGNELMQMAEHMRARGFNEQALLVHGSANSLIEEGLRQNVKQFKRILVPRIEAAIAKGSNMDYSKLMTKIRILESVTIPPPKGAIPISLEEARMVLKNQFNTTIEAVVEECGQAILDVNAVL